MELLIKRNNFGDDLVPMAPLGAIERRTAASRRQVGATIRQTECAEEGYPDEQNGQRSDIQANTIRIRGTRAR